MFYDSQSNQNKNKYKEYLRSVGSLSNLFSESNTPYLYYRAAEKIFCLAFGATDLSRFDVSADVKFDKTGIGLKTFLHRNGSTFQKVAEFNSINSQLVGKQEKAIIRLIAESKNKRIKSTIAQYDLDKMIYHCVTRLENRNSFYECRMDSINLDAIVVEKEKTNSIKFTDGVNEYSFNKSKNTLFRRFPCIEELDTVDIEIVENPFELLSHLLVQQEGYDYTNQQNVFSNQHVYLPLYAPSSINMHPAKKSGLNHWNASGRPRHHDEVYIPVPAWIHHTFPDFFPNDNQTLFNLVLPDGANLEASMCQAGRKGLMSNPNRVLGRWLLRDVLQLPQDTLITRDILNMANIDSARVEKIAEGQYKIGFASVGKYENFKRNNS